MNERGWAGPSAGSVRGGRRSCRDFYFRSIAICFTLILISLVVYNRFYLCLVGVRGGEDKKIRCGIVGGYSYKRYKCARPYSRFPNSISPGLSMGPAPVPLKCSGRPSRLVCTPYSLSTDVNDQWTEVELDSPYTT